MKKYSSSFFVYKGERRIFLSTDSAVINVKILKEIYSKFPDLDKYGYRKQLSSLKKNYVICLNTTQTIDLVFLNMLSSDKKIFFKPESNLIFLSDYYHKVIQSDNYKNLELIHQNLLKHKRIRTICNPDLSKAKIQLKKNILSLTEDSNENFYLWQDHLAYMLVNTKDLNYRLKDFEVMLLPFAGNQLLDLALANPSSAFLPMEKMRHNPDITAHTLQSSNFRFSWEKMERKTAYRLIKMVNHFQPVHDYLVTLYSNAANYYFFLQVIPYIERDLDIPDYWDLDENTADYYYESGQYWLKKADPENYKLFRSFVRKIFQEYKLLSKTRKKIFSIMIQKSHPIISTIAFLRDSISPTEFENNRYSLQQEFVKKPTSVDKDRAKWVSFSNQVFEVLEVLDPYQGIKTLIDKDESEKLEFKSTYRYSLHKKNYDNNLIHEVLKTLSAFLNTSGGMLIIGVSDDKEIIGIEKDGFKSSDKFMLTVEQVMIKFFGKSVASKIKVRVEEYQAKKICIIECEKASEPVIIDHYADKKTKELFFVRTGPSTVQLGLREYQKYLANFKSKK